MATTDHVERTAGCCDRQIYVIIGPATLAGFAFMCAALVPVNAIKTQQQRAQRAKMGRADGRAKLVEETFR